MGQLDRKAVGGLRWLLQLFGLSPDKTFTVIGLNVGVTVAVSHVQQIVQDL